MMTPRDYYRKLSHDITDSEIRFVAFTMADYIGEDNAVRLEDLCKLLAMEERKVRMILERLVTEYRLPVQPALLDVPEPDIIPYWRW